MVYILGLRSKMRLRGVHPDLVRVVKRAIEITPIDFTVLEGRRTLKRQKHLVNIGASKTLNSRHIPKPGGYGHAVDIAPYIEGQVRWDWPPYYILAEAMRVAARLEDVPVIWGGVWGLLGDMDDSPEEAVAKYVNAKMATGQMAFIDGPHYELPRSIYP